MRSRLENYVGQMRTQTMTFSNEGVELCLNIPDNASVKETLQMFINTIVQQQDQISGLQSTMKQMSIDNLTAQKNIISWTTELVAETQKSLQEKMNESNRQVQNFAYNVQGFADKIKNDQPDIKGLGVNVAPPILQSMKAFEDVEDGNFMSLPNASEAISSSNSISANGSGPQKTKIERMPRPESKEYYNLVRKNNLPDFPAARWRWAFRRIVKTIRNNKLQIALTRLRLMKGASIAERLARLEAEMFKVPADMQESLRRKADEVAQHAQKDTDNLQAELDKLAALLAAQQEKSTNLLFLQSSRIDEVKASCAHLDRTCDDLDRAITKLSAMRNKQAKVSHKKLDHPSSGENSKRPGSSNDDRADGGKGMKGSIDKGDATSGDKVDTLKVKKGDGDKSERAEQARANRLEAEREKGERPDGSAGGKGDTGRGNKSGSEKGVKGEKGDTLTPETMGVNFGEMNSPSGDKTERDDITRRRPSIDGLRRYDSTQQEGLDDDLGVSADAADVEAADESNKGFDADHADRVDNELDSLNRRMNCTEISAAQTLQGKVSDLQSEVEALQDSTTIALKQMMKCKARLNMIPSSSSEIGSVGDSVASLSQLDKDLKDIHRTRWALESRVTALKDLHRSFRGEVFFSAAPSARRAVGGSNSPRVFSSDEAKQNMLTQCDQILSKIHVISVSLSDSESDSAAYSSLFGQQWNTLIQLMSPNSLGHPIQDNPSQTLTHQSYPASAQASGASSPNQSPMGMRFLSPIATLSPYTNAETPVAFHSPVLDKLKKEMQSRASVEDVRVISRETITGALAHALGPIRSKIEYLEGEIATLKGAVVTVKDTASVDRKWMQATAEEMKRRDEEQKKREAEHMQREETQRKTDEEQRKKDLDQRSQDDRRNYEDEQRRRDDDQRRREEEQKEGEDMQQRDSEGSGLPPGIIACFRQEIEIPSKSDLLEDDEDEAQSDVTDKALAKTATGSKFPVAPSKNPSPNNRIEEGITVNIVSGNYRGQQGIIVNIREIPKDEESPTADRMQYHVKLEHVARPAVSPSRKSRPGSAMPRRREVEDKTLQRSNLEIMKLRDEIQQMEIALKTLSREKITGYQAQQMIEQRAANQGTGDDKVDNEAFAVVEVAVRNLASELEDLRNLQTRRLATVKKQLEESFSHLSLHQTHSVETEGGGPYSAVITTGQCLGCGRLSAINGVPNILHNPETVRAGFRMPYVTPPIAPFRSISPGPIGGSETESVGGTRPVSAALVAKSVDISGNQHTTQESMDLSLDSAAPQYRTTRPRTSSGTFSASQRTSSRGAVAAGLTPVATGVMVHSQSQSTSHKRLGSDDLASRTLQRSGFAGKKSAKAEHVYAPERFDPPPDFSLPHYNKLNSAALSAPKKSI